MAYEHSANCIALVYDGAESNVRGAHSTGEMRLAYVVDRHHNGSISLPSRDWDENEFVLRRHQTEEVILLRVERVGPDRDS
jgi:hypothetical protein